MGIIFYLTKITNNQQKVKVSTITKINKNATSTHEVIYLICTYSSLTVSLHVGYRVHVFLSLHNSWLTMCIHSNNLNMRACVDMIANISASSGT